MTAAFAPHARYADGAWHGTVTVDDNVQLARDIYRVRFTCPEIARQIVPGQFLMLRLAAYNDPLLGRPLALYDTVLDAARRPVGIDVVYMVLGKMTGKLARFQAGQKLDVWGPLGNGFTPEPCRRLIMVAGGIGQTPFMALAREALGLRAYGNPPRGAAKIPQVKLLYGARNRDYLAGVEDFQQLGVEVQTSTDDGSAGHHGLVTDLLRRELDHSTGDCRVVCCGPERMMEAVAEITYERRVPCQVSLETPMACGIGICFSCVARVRDASGQWDYRRTCVEGPVFEASAIEF
jgi:dihydroorotate dehydrogenase electron transfer subunit